MDREEEIYRLTKDNNKILHRMRRNAFIGGIVKFIFYILVLVIAPLWLYVTYLSPVLDQAMQTIDQVQGTSVKAQAQFQGFQDALKKFQSQFQN